MHSQNVFHKAAYCTTSSIWLSIHRKAAYSSLSRKAQDKIQEPQVPSDPKTWKSLGLLFFSKHVISKLQREKYNIPSRPNPPQLPFTNSCFLRHTDLEASCNANKGFSWGKPTCLFNRVIILDIEYKYKYKNIQSINLILHNIKYIDFFI